MRRFVSPIVAFVLVSPLVAACADDVPQGTDSMSASESSSGSSSTTQSPTTTTNSGTGTGTGEPTTGPTTSTSDPTNPTTESTGTTTTETTGSTSETTGEPITCCAPQPGPSCGDPAIEACVCATDPTCCEQAWTDECALLVNKLECGSCPIAEGPCCLLGNGAGCLEDPIEECVCAQLPDCCTTQWGDECVAGVELLGCGVCGVPPKEACCEAHMSGGCVDPAIEQCVCGLAPDCCNAWTPECVEIVELGGCGMCEGGDKGQCCVENQTPGCMTPEVEACVCAQDPFCCEEQWDLQCADEVETLGCGICQGMDGDCCSPGNGPGCIDPQIEQCVCSVAPSCCNDKWTDACAALVEPLQCGSCGMDGTGCCEAHLTPSCDDQAIADCVCAQDDFCCNFEWDGLCVAEVEMFGCGMCN